MPFRRKTKSNLLAARLADIAFAVPQVVAHRMARMAATGASLSKRDREEFHGMIVEKAVAFGESLNTMTMQAFRVNQALAVSFVRTCWSPFFTRGSASRTATATMHGAALSILSQGVAPIHRKVVANAKRLSRTKLR